MQDKASWERLPVEGKLSMNLKKQLGSPVRLIQAIVISLLVLFPVSGFAEPVADANALLDRWVTAFNTHDLEATAQLYTSDAVFFGVSSPKLSAGRESIRDNLNGAPETGASVSIIVRSLVTLSDVAVVAAGFYQFDLLEGETRVPRLARFTFVITKHGDEWLIAHHHSSLVPPAPLQ
jgi:uncharacterized protein (TIGR02246 family)